MRSSHLALLAMLASQPLAAQVIRGVTLDASNRAYVPATLVTLLSASGDSAAAAVTDERARFVITPPSPGTYRLRAQRIGFDDVETAELALREGEEVSVEILLGADPIELDPLTVTSRRGGFSGTLGSHRRRADWIQRTGIGKVITRDQIAAQPRPYVTDYFYTIAGMRVVGSGADARVVMRGCAPSVYLDGVRATGFAINMVTPESVEGIEIYRSVSEVPAELRGVSGCGAIAVYTRSGERIPGKWTLLQKIFAVAGGSALGLLLITSF